MAYYVISSLASVVAWIRPARYVSLFYWAVGSNQLTDGLTASSAAVLIAAGIALLASAVAFSRLDLY